MSAWALLHLEGGFGADRAADRPATVARLATEADRPGGKLYREGPGGKLAVKPARDHPIGRHPAPPAYGDEDRDLHHRSWAESPKKNRPRGRIVRRGERRLQKTRRCEVLLRVAEQPVGTAPHPELPENHLWDD
ncbi:hypothetical protein HY523_00230 [Candidatus Berkelbacteria bacterium]|nr:hypothetical protein [Candidatus Berkelbacteria bacterium]